MSCRLVENLLDDVLDSTTWRCFDPFSMEPKVSLTKVNLHPTKTNIVQIR